MSIETAPSNDERVWEILGTELPNGLLARFVGHDVTKPEHVAMLHKKVANLLADAQVDSDTCFNAKLIVAELAANAIENGKHRLSEVDVVVLYTPDDKVSEVTISVINPVDENTRLEYRKREQTVAEMAQKESGRGRDITAALTGGKWGWEVVELNVGDDDAEPRDGDSEPHKELSVVTFAVLGGTGIQAALRDDLRHAS